MPDAGHADLDVIQDLANRGRHEEALSRLEQLIRSTPCDWQVQLLHGQLQLAVGRWEEAVSDMRRSLFLDPSNLLVRFWYALALRDARRWGEALGQATVLIEELKTHSPETVLADGRTTAGELLQVANQLEEQLR